MERRLLDEDGNVLTRSRIADAVTKLKDVRNVSPGKTIKVGFFESPPYYYTESLETFRAAYYPLVNHNRSAEMRALRLPRSRTCRACVVIAATILGCGLSQASDHFLRIGSMPCESDWLARSQFEVISSFSQVKYLEQLAAVGNIAAQLRLGLTLRSADGAWSAPKDRSYNIAWLEKAIEKGSKSAAWELASIQYGKRLISHEEYLRAAMVAAESEGNPWAASLLMNLTNGRLGTKPTECYSFHYGECAPDELLPESTAVKWATIAAEGGNVAAQEWLCFAAVRGNVDRGQPRSVTVAATWCTAAARSTCSHVTVGMIPQGKLDGISATEVIPAREKLELWKKQPWRVHAREFFSR